MEELYREWMRDWKPAGNSKFKMAAKIRGVLIDLSGTIHVENSVIPGSIQALKRYGRTDSFRLFRSYIFLLES